jgi:hypothetical protein
VVDLVGERLFLESVTRRELGACEWAVVDFGEREMTGTGNSFRLRPAALGMRSQSRISLAAWWGIVRERFAFRWRIGGGVAGGALDLFTDWKS